MSAAAARFRWAAGAGVLAVAGALATLEWGAPSPGPFPAPAPFGAARTHLLVARHEPTNERAQVRPLRLQGAGLEAGAEVDVAALPLPKSNGHFVAVFGHGGGATWVSAEPAERGFRLVVRETDGPPGRAAAVPLRPAALHVIGDGVVVGSGNVVGWVDLTAAAPKWREVHRRQEMKGKAYDVFARAGAWLVAIDDMVLPMYADSFRLDARGRPAHDAGWEMPGLINGHYDSAVLAADGERDGVLYTVTPFSVLDGDGQDLAALPMRGGALNEVKEFDAPIILNRGGGRIDPPVLEEHRPRDPARPTRLAAGAEFTWWAGLALDGPRLLVAAGKRGLLVLPRDFKHDTKAAQVDVGGECRDVLVADGRVWALVGGPENAVVELAWGPEGARPRARTPLAAGYDRFVH